MSELCVNADGAPTCVVSPLCREDSRYIALTLTALLALVVGTSPLMATLEQLIAADRAAEATAVAHFAAAGHAPVSNAKSRPVDSMPRKSAAKLMLNPSPLGASKTSATMSAQQPGMFGSSKHAKDQEALDGPRAIARHKKYQLTGLAMLVVSARALG
jgi:hypothetical protein